MAQVDYVPIIDDKTYGEIWKRIIADPRYRPMHIIFEKPYDEIALWVEHGTGPARKGLSKGSSIRNDGLDAKKRIGMWTERMYPGRTKDELDEMKNDMYERIMQAGTPPHPFIRPAIEDVIMSGEARRILENGGSTLDVVETIKRRMEHFLNEGNHVRYSDGSDSIVRHIRIEPYTDFEETTTPYTVDTVLKEWEALDETMASKHAQNLAAYRARKKGAKKR